jgi:hypothetical protein
VQGLDLRAGSEPCVEVALACIHFIMVKDTLNDSIPILFQINLELMFHRSSKLQHVLHSVLYVLSVH